MTGPRHHEISDLYFHQHPFANQRLDMAFEQGHRSGRAAAFRKWLAVMGGMIAVAFLLGEHAHAQQTMAPFNTAGINSDVYVGQIGYPTIQSAVNYACGKGAALRVVIPAGATPTDSVAGILNGCAAVTVFDQRSVNTLYSLNSGSYTSTTRTPQLTGGALGTLQNLAAVNAASNLISFSDGSGRYWAAGASFLASGVFADDETLSMIAYPDLFDSPSMENILTKFIALQNTRGEMPVGVASNGTAVTFWSSFDLAHNHASGDAMLMLPQMQYLSWQKSASTAGISAHIAALKLGLTSAIPIDSNGLCMIGASDRWMPWLFEETALSTGDVTMCSAWLARDYQVMAAMYTAIGDTTNASLFQGKLSTILSALSGTSSPLWNSATGMYRMATGQNSTNVDVDGSALLSYFGFTTVAQDAAMSAWLAANYNSIALSGFVRQSNTDFAYCGSVNANGTQALSTTGLCASGDYQQGVWAVQLGWVLRLLYQSNPTLAIQLLNAYIAAPTTNSYEWFGWTSQNHGSTLNLESNMGAVDFIEKNPAALPALTRPFTAPGFSSVLALLNPGAVNIAAQTPTCFDGLGQLTSCSDLTPTSIELGSAFIPPQRGVFQAVGNTALPDVAFILARAAATNNALNHVFTGSTLTSPAGASATGYEWGLLAGDAFWHLHPHTDTVNGVVYNPLLGSVTLTRTGGDQNGGCYFLSEMSSATSGVQTNRYGWCLSGPAVTSFPSNGAVFVDQSAATTYYPLWLSTGAQARTWTIAGGGMGWSSNTTDPRAGVLDTGFLRCAAGQVGVDTPQGGATEYCGSGSLAAASVQMKDTTNGHTYKLVITNGAVALTLIN